MLEISASTRRTSGTLHAEYCEPPHNTRPLQQPLLAIRADEELWPLGCFSAIKSSKLRTSPSRGRAVDRTESAFANNKVGVKS